MKQIVFATNNEHKLREVRKILGNDFQVLSLKDIGFEGDIPETGQTLMDNAAMKAQYIYNRYHMDVFADDTGLEVEALDGAPGVHSARYAGEGHNSQANMNKLLSELEGEDNRQARFVTIIALIQKLHNLDCVWSLQFFSGIVNGKITKDKSGSNGFGYDPIFRPDGYTMTFADLSELTKNEISHRAIAIRKLKDYLMGKR